MRPMAGRPASDGREGRATGPGIVRAELAFAAVHVAVTGDVAVLLDVGRIGHPGRRGRARDVRDRGDVVPVDAVADAEQQPREQHADVHGGGGGGCAGTDQIDHVEVLAGRLVEGSRHRSISQQVAIEGDCTVRLSFRTMTASGSLHTLPDADWGDVRDRLRARGLRWTPQRRTLIEVLSKTDGHVTGSELVERCRAIDPGTIPSTVYRTLDVLEELGLLSHSHGADGREEFHVLPAAVHGHLHCVDCGTTWEIEADEAAALVSTLALRRDFAVDVSHLSIAGRCRACAAALDR